MQKMYKPGALAAQCLPHCRPLLACHSLVCLSDAAEETIPLVSHYWDTGQAPGIFDSPILLCSCGVRLNLGALLYNFPG